MTDNKLIERLQERAEGYRQSGPSAEHTATLLSEAAAALTAALAVEQDMSTAEPVSVTVKEAMEVAKEINDFIGGELRQTFWWEQKAKLMAQALSALSHVQTPATCENCGGEGTLYTSKYGGNDPDVWPIGTCEECKKSGKCQYSEAVAMPEYRCVDRCQYAVLSSGDMSK